MDNSSSNHGRVDADDEILQNKGIDIERIRNAKKRRILQLKRWSHYDKMKEKEEASRQKKGFRPVKAGPKSVTFCQNLILLEAGNSGDADEVRKLLSKGVCADVANSDGLTALHQCAINNNIDMCRILIHYKANVNAKDKEMWTPLHAAAICGHSEICQLLIKNGADLLALNTDGNMPYDICEDEVTLDIIENEMAAKGVTQDQINATRNLPEQHMLNDLKSGIGRLGQSGAVQLFSQLDKQGANQLHIAAACGYVEVTRLLVSIGMPVDGLDKDGWQAIHVASLHSHLEVIEVLVSNGANIDSHTKQGETVYELVYDAEVYEKLLLLKQEIDKRKENQSLTASVGLVRRRSSTNPRSASIRRTSMKEKSFLSWKEARLEAEIRLSIERKNPSESNRSSPNHYQEANDANNNTNNNGIGPIANNRESFVNTSLRGKAFALSESIAEVDYAEGEPQSADLSQIEFDLDPSRVWALPGLANNGRTDKLSFTHPHPYNSPTRDPSTFPYNPKPVNNSTNSSKPQRESGPKSTDGGVKPRDAATSKPAIDGGKQQREQSAKSVDSNNSSNKHRQSSEKPSSKKISTLPHTHHDTEEVVDAKPLSMRSNKAQSKSPNTSQRQLPPARSSVNSAKTTGSGHTTPITTPRSSQLSVARKPNRQSIKPANNSKNGPKSGKPDSCCAIM